MTKLSHLAALLILTNVILYGQAKSTPPLSVEQKAERSACSNIIALTGNVNLNCSTLTAEQGKAMLQIRDMLRKMTGNQIDPSVIAQMNNKLDELLAKPNQGSITQSNSGGINIQQGTTGVGSPIINSPITVGNFPKTLSGQDKSTVISFLAQAPSKAKISVIADQFSGTEPFPDDFYDALKSAGWPMVEAGVSGIIGFSAPGKKYQGAMITVKGEPLAIGEGFGVKNTDPLFYIGTILDSLKIPRSLQRNMSQPEGVITIEFVGGFPN